MTYDILLNQTRKEYWVAEPKYHKEIDRIIDDFNKRGQIVTSYPSDHFCLREDIATEEYRGYKKATHYLDWDR